MPKRAPRRPQAARELIRIELPEILKLSGQLPGYEIQIVGHSLGGAPAAGMREGWEERRGALAGATGGRHW